MLFRHEAMTVVNHGYAPRVVSFRDNVVPINN